MNAPRTTLRELAWLFLRLGATAFGGPAAHIAIMRDEVVARRHWLSDERFLDLIAAVNLIPGPNSTEMAMHVGWERRGLAGLVVAGACFILPAMCITGALGWAYVEYGSVPEVGWLLYGVKPVIFAIIVQVLISLFPKAAKSRGLWILALLAVIAVLLHVHELAVLFGAGLMWVLASGTIRRDDNTPRRHLQMMPVVPLAVMSAATSVSYASLFWIFFKIGSVLYGSGYVLVAFVRTDLVERLEWLTESQLLDAIAIGQVTPGPVFTTATFIGYILAGPGGALLATLAIFLPAFVLVALSGPLIPRLRSSQVLSALLDGLSVASLALLMVVTVQLAPATFVDVGTVVLAALALAVLLRFKLNSAWLVLGGAAIGALMRAIGIA